MYLLRIPHTLLGACMGVDLTVLSGFVHRLGPGLHSYFCVLHFCKCVCSPSLDTAALHRNELKYYFFQLLVLDFSGASGCTSAGLQLVPPHILPPKIKHGPVTTRREVPSSLLSASCRKCHCILLSVVQSLFWPQRVPHAELVHVCVCLLSGVGRHNWTRIQRDLCQPLP